MTRLSEAERSKMAQQLNELRTTHRDLDGAIDALAEKGAYDNFQMQRLKKQKLQIKDRIVRLESTLLPDIIA